MDKKIAGLLGAVGACLTLDAAGATAVQGPAQPQSYADLLQPIPNAKAALDASDADLASKARSQGNVQVAETVIIRRRGFRHHHHHHHHFFRRPHERVIIRR